MKTNVIILSIMLTFLSFSNCQLFIKTAKANKITNIDYSVFLGKKVEYLLDSVGLTFTDTTFYYDNHFILEGCFFTYEVKPKLYVDIKVKSYEHLNPFYPERNWTLDDFKKETIYSIRVFYKKKYIQEISSYKKVEK
jgi:hypothetical protein